MFTDVVEATDWFPNELQASLLRLIKAGIAVDLGDANSKHRSKPSHIDKLGERLNLA
ncbi:hypothetical protein [Pelomonas cellulosilytica]|uniref:Uncharacterized protein n=1 Tax=Pelomonas cellulosilytica TaxID=2906762 RepID=A0ABS8XZ28_9BURK|nr:hypothetical protein [Pelomonas sp. P8]MCE4556925.1 hypothetical protein [Pelomonas sp. P8]